MARIAVMGATGHLGGHAVARLLSDHHKVRAIVRRPERAALPAGVEIVRGDVTDPTTLTPALAGVDGVLLALNGGSRPARAEQVENQGVANAAIAAEAVGAQRIILLSGMFSQPAYALYPWEQAKARGEQQLMSSPVASTVFRIGFINETLARFMRHGRPILIGRQRHPIRPIAVDDIMAAASRAFSMPHTANRAYGVAGGEAMTLRQATAAYATAITGTPVEPSAVRMVPLGVMRVVNRLVLRGEMTRPLGILASMDRYGDVAETTDWFRDFGAPPTPFSKWIARLPHPTPERPSS